MKIKSILVVFTTPRTNEQKDSLTTIRKALKSKNLKFKLANRDKLRKEQFNDKELVMAVGGDGTFLRAAQFISNQMILGINADPKNKEGFFMSCDKNDFESKLKRILKNDCSLTRFPRLEAHIDNKKIDTYALNEFFIGPKKSYHAAKYVIRIGGFSERHKSSGILITTPAGSHAWAKACNGKTLPLDSRQFQFIVREPYEGNVFGDYRLKFGLLGNNQKIIVISEMLDGIIVGDSVSREYQFKNGSKAIIKLSDNYLNAIWMK